MAYPDTVKEVPPNNWDTFIKHAWLAGTPRSLEDWPTVKRCEDAAHVFHHFGCRSILDAAAAYGMKTIQFKRLGFDVVGLDIVERVEKDWEGNHPQIWWNTDTPEGQVTTIHMSERFPKGIFHHFLHVIDKQTLEHSGYYNSFEWTLDDYTDIVKEVGFSTIELPSGRLEAVARKPG